MLTLEDHPARRRDPETDEMVPAFPDLRQIMDNGARVAYCGTKPNAPITFVRFYPADYVAAVRQFVEKQFGEVSKVGVPPDPKLLEEEEEEDDDDE